jgi:ribosomal protein S18 acetylase RimI-like enzyme
MSTIRIAASAEDFALARELFREYVLTPGVSVCVAGLEEELATLDRFYLAVVLAFEGERTVGCGALRIIEPGVGEMKRVYVRPEARGSGVARALTLALLEQAKGLNVVRLDTLPSMVSAIRLYESLGFRPTGPYASSHPDGALCYELTLGRGIAAVRRK